MTKLWDNPRPKGYWPGTPSQWNEPTIDDCTWYATEFGFEAASETHRSVHPVKGLRRFSTDTSGGTPVSVAIRDTQRLWPSRERVLSEYGTYSRRRITQLLRSGATLVFGGDYIRLPLHYRRWTNNDRFLHAIATRTIAYKNGKARTFWYDPLGGGSTYKPYDGEWITLNDLLNHYAWKTPSGDKWYAGLILNKGDAPMKRLHLHPSQPANREVRVRGGTVVRVAPRITSDKVRVVWGEKRWYPLVGNARDNWKLIAWNLAESQANIGYIRKVDIIETKRSPLTVPEPPTDPIVDVAALKLTNKALRTIVDELRLQKKDNLLDWSTVRNIATRHPAE